MLIKLVLLFFTITASVANSVEFRKKPSIESINFELEDLQAKLRAVIAVKNEANVIFIETGVTVFKVCLTTKLDECKDLSISIDTNLTALRDIFKTKNIAQDNDCNDWRFIKSKAKIDEADGKLTVDQSFIIEKSVESEFTLRNFENIYIRMINLYDVNLEQILVVQGLTETNIIINPVVSLHWLRQVLSKRLTCPNASWKGPNQSILDESENSKWRVYVRNINTADAAPPTNSSDVSSDLTVDIGDEANIKVNSKIYVNVQQNRIDYHNIHPNASHFIATYVQNFTGPDKTMILVTKTYPEDNKLKPLMLSNMRYGNQQSFEYQNVAMLENSTAVAFVITHPNYEMMYLELYDHSELISYGIGNYLIFYSDSHRVIEIEGQKNQGSIGDTSKFRLNELTVKMIPVISYESCKNYRRIGDVSSTRPFDYERPGWDHRAVLKDGEYVKSDKFRGALCNIKYAPELIFKFHITCFVTRGFGEKLWNHQKHSNTTI